MTNIQELCSKIEKDMKEKNVKAKVFYKNSEQQLIILISLKDITDKLKGLNYNIKVENNILKVIINNIRGD